MAVAPPTRSTGRRLVWEACYNARDLGGYAVGAGRHTRWGRFVRSDNLCRLSATGQDALVAAGVRTIIDLRSAFELRLDPCPFESAAAAPGAPAYLHRPLLDPAAAAEAAAIERAESVAAMYAAILAHSQPRLAAILRAVAVAPAGGVLVYCHAGKDRTGLVTALVLAVAGVPAATIAEDYALSDGYLQPWYDEQLRRAPDGTKRTQLMAYLRSAHNAARPETMVATLDDLDRQYGGPQAYLRAAGLGEEEIAAIRRRLVG